MGLADELTRLEELRSRGALNDEEYQRAKARVLGGAPADAGSRPGGRDQPPAPQSATTDWLGGVCGGLAVSHGCRDLDLAPDICRARLFFGGFGLLIYVLLWIFVPEDI